MTTLDELRALLSAAEFGALEFVQTDEDDGYIDDDNHEKPIAQAVSVYHGFALVAAVNALPGLLDRVERLEAALKPFTLFGENESVGDMEIWTYAFYVGDIRRARAALAKDATT